MGKLSIKNISSNIDKKRILDNFNLLINDGEIHAIMGPNGVGKSTITKVIMGDSDYIITNGDIVYNEQSIINLPTDKRSRLGIFLAMQNPISIDGVSNQDFLRTALSAHQNQSIGLYDFIVQCEQAITDLKMDKNLIHRGLNVGFSGGERKKNEVLQIKLLKPSLIILDELDSGLDVDSLKIVCDNINEYKKEYPKTSILIITHYPKILQYLNPDYVHVMLDGKIATTGNMTLANEIEKNGYKNYLNKTNNIVED